MYSSPSSHDLAYQNKDRPQHIYFPFLVSIFPHSPAHISLLFDQTQAYFTVLEILLKGAKKPLIDPRKCLEDINFKRFGWITAAQCMPETSDGLSLSLCFHVTSDLVHAGRVKSFVEKI